MTATARTVLFAVAAFLVAGLLAYLGGRAMHEPETPPSALPELEEPVPAVVPIEVAPDDDVAALAVEYTEQDLAGRTIASEIEVPLDPGPPGPAESAPVAGTGGTPDHEADPDTGEITETEPPPPADDGTLPAEEGTPIPEYAPPGEDEPAEEVAIDECADAEDGSCPDGVGGTILAAIRGVPPLAGYTAFDPPSEPDDFYVWRPTCPEIEVPAGAAYFGASLSRPATATVRYRAGRWTGSSYEVEGTHTFSTTEAEEAGWYEWLEDETLPDNDPRAWISHCFLIEDLPPRSDYIAFVDYAAKDDPSITATNWPHRIDFAVVNERGVVPGAQRRPTFLFGHGIDELFIGVTAEPGHTFHGIAIENGTPGACDTGGDESTVLGRTDVIRSRRVSDVEISPEVLEDPGYSYLPSHSRSIVHRMNLTEGTDYALCLYWTEAGTTFDRRVVDISEEVFVSTPEAYRPRVLFHGVTGLFGEIDQVNLLVDDCGYEEHPLDMPFRAGDDQLFDEPIELCTASTELTALDRGIRVMTVVHDTFEDSWPRGGRFIRTDLECDVAPCLLRLPEMAMIPLPEIPTERRLCGTGFGGGCEGEVPMRSAGFAVVEVQFVRTPGNGLTEWSIGDVAEFEDTTPPPGEGAPKLDVDVSYSLVGHPNQGAVADVTITADREVTFSAGLRNSPDCGLVPEGDFGSDTFATVHTFQIRPLCLGNVYDLNVVAFDRTREEQATIVDIRGEEIGPEMQMVVPPVWLRHDISTTIVVPHEEFPSGDGILHTVYVRPVSVAVPTIVPPYGTSLGWSWPVADREAAARLGWQMFGLRGQANACGQPDAGPLTVNASNRGSLMPQDEITLTFVVDVHRNLEVGGAVVGECAVGELIATHTLQATVTLAELMDGVTITSEGGEVTFTIDGTTWRRELVG